MDIKTTKEKPYRVHVIGPAHDYGCEFAALRHANELNRAIAKRIAANPNDPAMPHCVAVVETDVFRSDSEAVIHIEAADDDDVKMTLWLQPPLRGDDEPNEVQRVVSIMLDAVRQIEGAEEE